GALLLTISSGKASSGFVRFGITTFESIVARTTKRYNITTHIILKIIPLKAVLLLLAENVLCPYHGAAIYIKVICNPQVNAVKKLTSVSITGFIESSFGS